MKERVGDVRAAVDINTAANETYSHNFPQTKLLQRNIEVIIIYIAIF